MKKLIVLVLTLAVVCGLLFAFNVSADEGTTVNIASEAEVTTPTTSWWITQNLGRLIDGNETTGMHSSCHDANTTVNFKFATERNITKIVMKVNGTATTTAQNKENLNANTDYKIEFGGKSVTVNAKDKLELVIDVNDIIDGFSISFYSGWSGDNALIREVEVYEYIPPVVEAATGNNIEDEATIKVTDGNSYITDFEYLRDNDPSTGLSAGNAADWINYHFLYSTPRAITKVKVVVNSTGTMYNVGSAEGTYVHETMSTLPNIYLRLYDANGNILYKLENQSTSGAVEVTKDGKTYMEYTFDLGNALYEDVAKVEIATLHKKDTKLGVWEVEIIDFQCQKDEDHKYIDATCSAPATCKFCGATTGEPSDEHTLLPANCGKPIRCQYCDYTEGDVTGEPHQWKNASYTAPKTCKVCGATEGDKWEDSDLPAFVRGPENDTITYEDIVGEVELIAGSTNTGDPTFVLDGEITLNGRWGGPTGSQIKITLKNEWEITDARIVIFANWAGMKISFYAADGTLLGEQNQGGLQANSDLYNGKIPENIQYTEYNGALSKVTYGDNDKAVKYIIITNTADKWGWVPAVYEVYFSGRERIPSNCSGHVFEATYPVPPTCTEEGTMVNKCTKCGEEEAPVVAPALGHNMGEYTVKVPANCDTAAVYEYACTRCGEVIERPTYIQDVTDYADYYSIGSNGAGGNTTRAQALFDNNMDSYLHASGQWFVESWIELDMPYYLTSVTVWTGSYYDDSSYEAYFTFWYQAPGSDEWIEVGSKDAGVILGGVKTAHTMELAKPVYADAIKIKVNRLASFAGQAFEAEVAGTLFPETAPLGHTWEVTETVAAACHPGYTLSTCTVCGETKTDDYTKAIGHQWANATCTAPKTCTVCEVTTGEALGHTWELEDYMPSTCTTAGYDAYVCACGETKREPRELDAENGHEINYSLEYDCVDPTCTAAGYMDFTCCYCGEEIYKELAINPEGHVTDYEKYVYVAPTCQAPGYEIQICMYCNLETKTDYDMDPDAHVWDDGVENADGMYYECTLCDATKTEITKGTAYNPIIAVDGDNTFVYYATGENYVVYKYSATEAGTITVTTDEGALIYVGENLMGWFYGGAATGGSYTFAVKEAGDYMIVISTDSEEYTLPETFNVSFAGLPALVLGDNNVVYDMYADYTNVIVNTPGEYVLTFGEDVDVLIVYGPYDATPIESGYRFTVAEGEKVTFAIGNADFISGTYVVNLSVPANIDNSAINGEYYLGADLIIFKDGIMTALGGEFAYTYNVDTGRIDTEAGIFFEMIDGTIYFRGNFSQPLHQHVGDAIISVVTDPTCTVDGYTTYLCKFCDTVIETVAGEAATGHNYVESNRVDALPGVAGSVTYTCTNGCGSSYSETIEALPEHTHTPVEIPAVRPMPSNDHIGWTAGVKCSECDETIVEPVKLVAGTSSDANFKINSATLSLGEDIGVTYNATHPANSDADSMYMVFVFDGKEFVVESAGVVSGNRYRFVFKGMRADLMTANIEAYVYAIENGNYVMKSHLQYSVKQYCVNQLKKSIDDDFKNLIFSVLNLGDCTQLAVDSTTPAEKLVSNVVTAETGIEVPGIAVETIDPAYNVQAITGDRTKGYDWKSGGIALGSSVQLKLQFTAAEIEGLVLKFDVAGQRTIEIDASELELGSDGRYTVYFQVKVLEYDDTITCTFEKDGAQVGSTLTYSVYTYLVRSYQNTKLPEADRNFMKAVYEYAEAVKVMNGN